MIAKYRKRHLIAWLLIAVVITTLTIVAYVSIPYLPH